MWRGKARMNLRFNNVSICDNKDMIYLSFNNVSMCGDEVRPDLSLKSVYVVIELSLTCA